MAVIFCDTDSELWYTHAEEYDIKVIRMPYTIDGVEDFSDLGENFDAKAFFDRMRNGSKCITIFSSLISKKERISYTLLFHPRCRERSSRLTLL